MRNVFMCFFIMSLALQAQADPIVTESTSNSTTTSNANTKSQTTVISPPPTAIAPAINTMNNDLCAVGISGAAQTQILGIAIGSTFRDENCERLKLAKTIYDMGMKVAAVSVMCQDDRVFNAMMDAGTPCPADGKIGNEAKDIWDKRKPNKTKPQPQKVSQTTPAQTVPGTCGGMFDAIRGCKE